MLNQTTVNRLNEMHLSAMAASYRLQMEDPAFGELAVARGEGCFAKAVRQYKKVRLLILDKWLLVPLTATEARNLLEIVEARYDSGSTCAGTVAQRRRNIQL